MTRQTGRGATSSTPRSVDVARLAGVSQKTVSRVFNSEPYVSEDVRRRVLQAAEDLGYRMNNAARALASGRTRSIGVVTLGTALYGPASLLMGIERAVRDTGYALRVVNTVEGDPAGVAGAVGSLLEQGVDGIVVSEPIDEGASAAELSVDVPVLVIGAPSPFAASRPVTSGGGADLLDPGRHRTPAGSRACDGPSPIRSATLVSRPGTGSPAGGPRSPPMARPSRPSSRATGRPPPDTRRAVNSPPTPR